MKKAFLIWIFTILGCISIFVLTLCFGKAQKVNCEIEQESFSFLLARGELKRESLTSSEPDENSAGKHFVYIKDNIIGKYSGNYDTIEKIKEYLSSNYGKIISVENSGYSFVGLGWIFKQFKI